MIRITCIWCQPFVTSLFELLVQGNELGWQSQDVLHGKQTRVKQSVAVAQLHYMQFPALIGPYDVFLNVNWSMSRIVLDARLIGPYHVVPGPDWSICCISQRQLVNVMHCPWREVDWSISCRSRTWLVYMMYFSTPIGQCHVLSLHEDNWSILCSSWRSWSI